MRTATRRGAKGRFRFRSRLFDTPKQREYKGRTPIFRSKIAVTTHFLAHLLEAIRRDGLGNFVQMLFARLAGTFRQKADSRSVEEDQAFDRRFGTDTAASISRWRISDVTSPNRNHATNYVASREKDVLMLFRMLPINPAEFICVDLGSGKGKVLLLAAEFGFKKIIGVEFSPSLHRIATANVSRYKSVANRDCEIACVCQDAAEFPIPVGNLVIFLYGPFYAPVFREVVDKLRHSLMAQERPVYLVNFGSPLAQAIRKVEFLQPLPGNAGKWIYSNRRHQEAAVVE